MTTTEQLKAERKARRLARKAKGFKMDTITRERNAAKQKLAAEACDHSDEGIYQVALQAADNAGSTVGAQDPVKATEEWLNAWEGTVSLILGSRTDFKFVTDASIEWFAARGIKA